MSILFRRKMSKQIQTFLTKTDEEIQKIDETLDQLDALLKTLPVDYQMDWIQEKGFDLEV